MATPNGAPTVAAALRILSFMAAQQGPVAAATLARSLDLPRSSVYRLLAELAGQGFVLHFPEARRYGLGIAAFELSSGYVRQEPVTRLGRPVLAALVDRVGESAHLAVLAGREVVYLVEERAPRRPALVTDVEVRLPSHLTASGRALLAALPREQVRALFPDPSAFTRRGAATQTAAGLRSELVATRARGYAVEDGEITEGLASVAVAVRDRSGWPVCSLALTFPAGDVDEARRSGFVEVLLRHAADLRRRLHGG
ncbi:IclR family transcriptional regulator [Kineococcus radiotolerans]|uniref:Transcriptional regulator IclR n=1 Tax=Kineococcus radiotolerans (strain ATCC BAA-149 / DSM 14245 / SRS30216) TaxID=266940 RepID=A6WGH4_KINRD|nr:IclR family transcriptional regulator [Kineococcus radiotolerans]ABS05913.1 Transcriptional regulator IclR [Kineococcus radiotolerans SRS30216 = ATCC BAA-149]